MIEPKDMPRIKRQLMDWSNNRMLVLTIKPTKSYGSVSKSSTQKRLGPGFRLNMTSLMTVIPKWYLILTRIPSCIWKQTPEDCHQDPGDLKASAETQANHLRHVKSGWWLDDCLYRSVIHFYDYWLNAVHYTAISHHLNRWENIIPIQAQKVTTDW